MSAVRYHEIPKSERKALTEVVLRERPLFRALRFLAIVAAVLIARKIAEAIVPKEQHFVGYICTAATLAGAISVVLWLLLVSPIVRREVVRRKNAKAPAMPGSVTTRVDARVAPAPPVA
jgi:hypothetical protein